MKDSVKTYLKKRCERTRRIYAQSLENRESCHISVIIPVLNEFPTITATVESLIFASKASPQTANRAIFVINNRRSASDEEKRNNGLCQEFLETISHENRDLDIVVVDAFMGANQMGEKDGVGFARKIGMDLALELGDEILCCLDGDTRVEDDYFLSAKNALSPQEAEFALFDFSHDKDCNSEDGGIFRYENFLKNHSEKLRASHSPYFPTAISPTILCTASAYAQCGGMRENLAGEDFYFLQALIKTCILGKTAAKISKENFINFPSQIKSLESCVHPSARISNRTPFGTGQTLQKNLPIKEFPSEFYSQLTDLYQQMRELCFEERKDLVLSCSTKIFLENEGFFPKLRQIRKNFIYPHKIFFQCPLEYHLFNFLSCFCIVNCKLTRFYSCQLVHICPYFEL